MKKSMLWLLCGAVILPPALWGCAGQQSDETSLAEQAPPPPMEEIVPPPPAAREEVPAARTEPTARPRTQSIPEERRTVTPPAPPATVSVVVPAGTQLEVSFPETVTSATAMTGDPVVATLRNPVVVGDRVAFPANSRVEGEVADVKPATKGFKDTGGAIAINFHRIVAPDGRAASIQTGFTKVAEGSAAKKGGIIAGSAVGGALLGKVLGKDTEGAAIVGGAIGTAVAGGTKGKEAVIKPEEAITVALEKDARTTMTR